MEIDMDIEKIISKMSLEEKISFCTGGDFWHTKAMPQYEVPAIMMSDGPHGLRCQLGEADMIGVNKSMPATCFPAAVTAGATWNEELYAKEGKAIGEEGLSYGVPLILGPGCNMKRNPLAGRNFEYISEDPYFAGKMAAAFIRGQQESGAASSLKHFAANNQEYKRQNGDSQLDERTLREIYLTAFELAVKEGKPDTVMCAYNKINGVHCSDSEKLLNDILREEWGFKGTVITDWGALNDRIEAFKAGCDLNMPGGSDYMERAIYEAVKNGSLDESKIDASVERILRLVEHGRRALEKKKGRNSNGNGNQRNDNQNNGSGLTEYMIDSHHELARKIAEQGAVLLKNEDNILPLATKDIALIGYMAGHMRYQGTGSSHINPTMQDNLTDAFPEITYIECCNESGNVTQESIKEAKKAAAEHEVVIVAAGLPDAYESEALDRENMQLPKGHDLMIEAVASVNKNTVVVLMGGSSMVLSWENKVKGILYLGLPGQAGGTAAYNLLTGKTVPSGKLTDSWVMSYEDVVSRETFGKKNVEYREGIYVGYRYYDKAGKKLRYPFGYGLSYTTFEYTNLNVDGENVSLEITNTGKYAGAEVVQLYIGAPQDGIFRPKKELKRFARVELEPGETKKVSFVLDERCFAVWKDGWRVPEGTYTVLTGSSSEDIRLSKEIHMDGEKLAVPKWQRGSWYETLEGLPTRSDWEKLMGHAVPLAAEPKKGQFTLDNSCYEMKDSSLVMKIQYKVTENIIAKSYGGKKDMSNPAYRMTLTCAVDCPLRAAAICSGGAMHDALMNGLLHMANGHYLKGIAAMLRRNKRRRK